MQEAGNVGIDDLSLSVMSAQAWTAVQIGIAVLIAGAALWCVYRHLRWMAQQRDSLCRPAVAVFVENHDAQWQCLDVVVKNFGQRSAYDIEVDVGHAGTDASGLILPPLIAVLAPHQQVRMEWEAARQRVDAGEDLRCTGSVRYLDEPAGNGRRRQFQTRIVLDPTTLPPQRRLELMSTHDLGRRHQQQRELLKDMLTYFAYTTTDTHTDVLTGEIARMKAVVHQVGHHRPDHQESPTHHRPQHQHVPTSRDRDRSTRHQPHEQHRELAAAVDALTERGPRSRSMPNTPPARPPSIPTAPPSPEPDVREVRQHRWTRDDQAATRSPLTPWTSAFTSTAPPSKPTGQACPPDAPPPTRRSPGNHRAEDPRTEPTPVGDPTREDPAPSDDDAVNPAEANTSTEAEADPATAAQQQPPRDTPANPHPTPQPTRAHHSPPDHRPPEDPNRGDNDNDRTTPSKQAAVSPDIRRIVEHVYTNYLRMPQEPEPSHREQFLDGLAAEISDHVAALAAKLSADDAGSDPPPR